MFSKYSYMYMNILLQKRGVCVFTSEREREHSNVATSHMMRTQNSFDRKRV